VLPQAWRVEWNNKDHDNRDEPERLAIGNIERGEAIERRDYSGVSMKDQGHIRVHPIKDESWVYGTGGRPTYQQNGAQERRIRASAAGGDQEMRRRKNTNPLHRTKEECPVRREGKSDPEEGFGG